MLPSASDGCAFLESWCRSVEDKHRSNPMEEQPTDSTKKSEKVSIV